jgi:DNA-binding transcriptional regulator YdaS (Cro superfamily)
MQAESPILKRLGELDRTQSWLARRLGVTPSTVNRWIKGVDPIIPRRRRELALALGVRMEDLFPEPVAA